MVDLADNGSPAERLHELLLALTGRLDDDALNTAREFAGAGRSDLAAELVTGSLVAGGIVVTDREQRELAAVLDRSASRAELADRLATGTPETSEPHRFTAPERVDDLATALRSATARLPELRSVWCATRITPAGVAAGTVPRRVLLAEVDGHTAVGPTGYQLTQALRRAGLACSVESFPSDGELPEYHRNALAVAHEVPLRQAPSEPPAGARHTARRARRASARAAGHGPNAEPAEPATQGFPAPLGPPGPEEDTPVPDEEHPTAEWPAAELGEPPRQESPSGGLPPIEDFPSPVRHRQEDTTGEETALLADGPSSPGPARTAPEQEFPAPGEQGSVAEFPRSESSWAFTEEPLDPAEQTGPEASPAGEESGAGDTTSNPNVPAAVDAKLTNRERNLLRKLHEELAQREQDREPDHSPEAGESVTRGSESSQDPRTTTVPGTGNFPPIGSVGPHSP
ncbi:hypothetical protein [Actinopolyspora mortivallis]|uniref:hypothetical protein n=1 Tax=Actinopolyspora mortivallis TaxID=33906 RepID=UPI001C63ADF4|nr:hypothetical protein [Actinopolyspora mortivallis]